MLIQHFEVCTSPLLLLCPSTVTLGNPDLAVLSLPVLTVETFLPQKISIVKKRPLSFMRYPAMLWRSIIKSF